MSKVKVSKRVKIVKSVDILFAAVSLLPNELEILVYEYLPTVEQYRREFIFDKYGFPKWKDCFLNIHEDPFDTKYKSVMKNWSLENINDYFTKWFLLPKTFADGLDFCVDICPQFKTKTEFLKGSNDLEWISIFRDYELREFEMMKDVVLINKYHKECKIRNDIKRKEYRLVWADLSDKERKKYKAKHWVNNQIFNDYLFAKNVCWNCNGKLIQYDIEDWRIWYKLDFRDDEKGKIFSKSITCIETGHVRELKSDWRVCNVCAIEQVNRQLKSASYYF